MYNTTRILCLARTACLGSNPSKHLGKSSALASPGLQLRQACPRGPFSPPPRPACMICPSARDEASASHTPPNERLSTRSIDRRCLHMCRTFLRGRCHAFHDRKDTISSRNDPCCPTGRSRWLLAIVCFKSISHPPMPLRRRHLSCEQPNQAELFSSRSTICNLLKPCS